MSNFSDKYGKSIVDYKRFYNKEGILYILFLFYNSELLVFTNEFFYIQISDAYLKDLL